MNKQKHKGEGTCRTCSLSIFKMVSLPLFFFSLPHFFFPKETPTIEDVLTYDLKTATSSPHSAVETTLKKVKCVCGQQGSHRHPSAGCACWLLNLCLPQCFVFTLTVCQLWKAFRVPHHMQIMSNYYGTCNPDTFDMACTTYSKMNAYGITQGDLTAALPLTW